MPSLLQFATLFNIFGTSLVLVLSLVALRLRPEPFFRYWTYSYACAVATTVVAHVLSDHPPNLLLWALHSGCAFASVWWQLRVGFNLLERPMPRRVIVPVMTLLLAISGGLLVAGKPYSLVLVPGVLFLVSTFAWVGSAMIRAGRRPEYAGLGWVGGANILRALMMISYPAFAAGHWLWLGFGMDAMLEISVGTAMVVFLLYRALVRQEAQNQALREAQERLTSTQEALANEKGLIDAVVANVPASIVYLDRELNIRWVNQFVAMMLGRQPGDFVGKSIYSEIPNLEQPDPRLEAVLASGETLRVPRVPYVLPTPTGDQHYWTDVSYVPVRNERGELDGILLLSVDVTAQAENEALQQERIAKLQELDRLKNDFLNAASHELRTPLTSILGYAEILEDGAGGPLAPEQLEFTEQIKSGARRLERIVDDMLDFARMEAGTFKLVPQATELVRLIREETVSLLPQAREKRVTLETELPDGPLIAEVDSDRIGQVLLNLLSNAIKFTPAGGSVRVSTQPGPAGLRVEVSDSGIGIAAEHLPRLFEKFYQVDPSATREHGGAGLGLAISKALIDAHGGSIGVASKPGEGSTFWFTLPSRGAEG